MPADTDTIQSGSKKSSKLPFLVGIVLAGIGGAGGFYVMMPESSNATDGQAVSSHNVPGDAQSAEKDAGSGPPIAFVAIDPIVISMPGAGRRDYLRFAAQLEVAPAYAAEVEEIKPRIVDVLNSYLRAVDIATLEDPASLIRLRAQMLRRIQIVAGEGRVQDLLIMEFVLS